MSTSITLPEMLQASQDFDQKKTDYSADQYKPVYFPDGKLLMEDKNLNLSTPFTTSHHAVYQLCTRLGRGTFGTGNNKSLPAEAIEKWLGDEDYSRHAAGILNAHIDRVDPKLFVRTFDGQARAFLSSRYAAVQNTDILEKVQEALDLLSQRSGKSVTPDIFRSGVTPDDLHLRFSILGADILPEGESSTYGLSLFIQNDEVGKSMIKAIPGFKRNSCNNSVWFDHNSDVALISRHVGESQLLADRLALAIGHGLTLAGEYLNRYLRSKQIELPNIFENITKMAEQEKWSVQFSDAVREGTEGQHSLRGMIDGLTYAAHHVYADDQASMTSWELRAGKLLFDNAALQPAEL